MMAKKKVMKMMLNNTIVLVDDESNLKSMRHGNNQFA